MMNESARKKVLDTLTRETKNQDAFVAWRVNGHAFGYSFAGYAECVGCGVRVSGMSSSGATRGKAVAEKASNALPPCTKPWNLEQRIREVEQRYSRTGQSGEGGGEITLESVNAKLDRIIQYLGIR
jgi:hypothetical protein